jgi:hypothetical protein
MPHAARRVRAETPSNLATIFAFSFAASRLARTCHVVYVPENALNSLSRR